MLGNAAWIWPHENLDAVELVVVLKKFAGREAESEPRGQRRLPLRIDDAADILLILNIELLTPVYVFRTWIGTKFWLLALGLRLRLGADICARVILLRFLRCGRSTHRVWINDDAAPGRAGNRRAGLVAKDAILSKMGGGDGLIARWAAPRDDKRAFIMVEAVVEAGLPPARRLAT